MHTPPPTALCTPLYPPPPPPYSVCQLLQDIPQTFDSLIIHLQFNGVNEKCKCDANLFVHKDWLKPRRDEVVCVTNARVSKLLLWFLGDWRDVLDSVGGDEVLVGLQAHQRAVCSLRNWWSPPFLIRILELFLCKLIASDELLLDSGVFFWGSTCLHTLFPKVWSPDVYLSTGGWGNCQITLHRQETTKTDFIAVNPFWVFVNLYFPYAGQGLLFFCWWQQHSEFQQYVWQWKEETTLC